MRRQEVRRHPDTPAEVTLELSLEQVEVLSRVLSTAADVMDCLGLDEWTNDESMEGKEEVLVDLADATSEWLPTSRTES